MLVADGGINKQAMRYVVQSARAGGIPVFSDFSDSAHFDWVLETGLMQASDWLVLNDAALLSLLRTLRRTEVLSEWTRLLRSPSVTAEEVRVGVEKLMSVVKGCVKPEGTKVRVWRRG